MIGKRKKPSFHRQQAHNFPRIAKKGWRRPRGKDSRQRRREKCKGARPDPGYCQPKALRHLHPSGLRDNLVHTTSELSSLIKEKDGVRIAACVGKRKRTDIVKAAETKGLRVFNK